MKQTDVDVILDRFYPCELVYAEAFNRETDTSAISWMDSNFAAAGGKFVVCLRKNYEGLVDDQYPDDLPTSMLYMLDKLYRSFVETTACDCLILETDDRDLNKQIKKIKMFLEIKEE